MRLNLYSLQLFVAVVEEGTIAGAAEREHIAASALSKRISELERAVDTPLLTRRARGVEPTAAGRILARGARLLLHHADDLSTELQHFALGASGHVRIAANLSSLTQFLPGDLKRFTEAHPRIQLDLEERVSHVVTRIVADNAADIGIYTDAADDGALEVFPYRRDRMVLVTRSDHPLAGADAVAFAQTLPFAYVGMHPGSAGNDQLLRAAEAAGAALTMHFQVTSYDAMISMIKAGLGIGVMPRDAIALFANEGLSIMPLSDAWANRQLKLCVRSKNALTSAARRLLDHLCAAAAETADGPATSAIAASS